MGARPGSHPGLFQCPKALRRVLRCAQARPTCTNGAHWLHSISPTLGRDVAQDLLALLAF